MTTSPDEPFVITVDGRRYRLEFPLPTHTAHGRKLPPGFWEAMANGEKLPPFEEELKH